MSERRKLPDTGLNAYDRKIINKYTGSHTNMIESNTAKTELSGDKRNNPIKTV